MNDREANILYRDRIENLVLDEIGRDSWLKYFIDYESIAEDSSRGEQLAGWDGVETICNKYCSEDIYIYRTN